MWRCHKDSRSIIIECGAFVVEDLYGLKQAAYAFWLKLLEAFGLMKYVRSKADPCLYFKWTNQGLVIWMSWVDDYFVCGNKKLVLEEKEKFKKQFECDEVGELKEYVGCKIDYKPGEGMLKLTQPVLLQNFTDEFKLPGGDFPITPAVPGDVLRHGDPESAVDMNEQRIYRSGTGKLLHMMKWSQPDILNPVRDLSRFMKEGSGAHMAAMY